MNYKFNECGTSIVPTLGDNRTPEVKEAPPVGLSVVANLNANINRGPEKKVRIEQYLNTEIKVSTLHNFKPTAPPPRDRGPLIQNGLTRQAQAKIKRSGRMLQHYARNTLKTKWLSFITLTYGKDWPDDPTAKNHLNRFLNKMRRRFGRFKYTWVVERQKRGAVHYHILTDRYIHKDTLNPMWDKIVAKWQRYMGYDRQMVRPNVIGIDTSKEGQAEHYLMKYLTKQDEQLEGNLYNISQPLRELMKPTSVYEVATSNPERLVNSILEAQPEAMPIEIEGAICEETGEIFMKNMGCFIKAGQLDPILEACSACNSHKPVNMVCSLN